MTSRGGQRQHVVQDVRCPYCLIVARYRIHIEPRVVHQSSARAGCLAMTVLWVVVLSMSLLLMTTGFMLLCAALLGSVVGCVIEWAVRLFIGKIIWVVSRGVSATTSHFFDQISVEEMRVTCRCPNTACPNQDIRNEFTARLWLAINLGVSKDDGWGAVRTEVI